MADLFPKSARPRFFASSAFWILLLAALILITYSNIFENAFLFDDLPAITENKATAPPVDLREIFLTPSWWSAQESDSILGYRPLTTLSFALNRAVSGLNPASFHAVNIFIHMANCLLIFFLLKKLSGSILLSGIAAVLFAVHPLQTEVVVGMVTRADGLAAFFVLLTLGAYILLWEAKSSSGRALLFGLAVLFFVAGLASKESAVCAVALIVAYELCSVLPFSRIKKAHRAHLSAKALVIAVLVLLGAGYIFWWRPFITGQFSDLVFAAGSSPPGLLHNRPLIWRITAFKVFALYIKLLIWPATLSGDYLFNQIPLTRSLSDPLVWLGVGLFLGGPAAAVLLLAKKKRIPAFGLLCIYAAYLPVSNLLVPIGVLMGERLFYLPALGFCILLALLIKYMLEKAFESNRAGWLLRSVAVCLVIGLISAYSGRAYTRNADWRNPYIFFDRTVQTSPRSGVAHYSVAVAYMKMLEEKRYIDQWMPPSRMKELKKKNSDIRGELSKKGLYHIQKALSITQKHPRGEYYSVYGSLLAMSGELDKAYAVLKKTLRLAPGLVEARMNLGVVCLRLASQAKRSQGPARSRLLDEAISSLYSLAEQKRHVMEPVQLVNLHLNLAIAQQQKGLLRAAETNIEQALAHCSQAVSQTGKGAFLFGRLYLVQASILAEQGKISQSIDVLHQAKQSGFPSFARYAKNMKAFRILRHEPQYQQLFTSPGKAHRSK
jgi:tetratricopeptide (TPR) repeat protein